jgi:hypothetical protein
MTTNTKQPDRAALGAVDGEQEDFESWATEIGLRTKIGDADPDNFLYYDDATNRAWEGWQARAALSARPSDGGQGWWAPKYGLLEVGELIQFGDESLRERDGHDVWKTVHHCVGEPRSKNHPPIRRRIPSPAPLDSAQGEAVGQIVPRFKGFSIVQLNCADLPIGTKLYLHPAPQQAGGG